MWVLGRRIKKNLKKNEFFFVCLKVENVIIWWLYYLLKLFKNNFYGVSVFIYVFVVIVKRGKKRKLSEFGDVISFGIVLGYDFYLFCM